MEENGHGNHQDATRPLLSVSDQQQQQLAMRDDDTNTDGPDLSQDFDDDSDNSSDDDEEDELAYYETQWVACLRLLVLTVLVVSAVLVSGLVHANARRAQVEQVHHHVQDAVILLSRAWQVSLENKVRALEDLAMQWKQSSKNTTTTTTTTTVAPEWPTLPDWETRAEWTRASAQASVLGLWPVVRGRAQQVSWEPYSVQHCQEWLPSSSSSSSLAAATVAATTKAATTTTTGVDDPHHATSLLRRSSAGIQRQLVPHDPPVPLLDEIITTSTTKITPYIFNSHGRLIGNDTSVFVPIWQTAPVTLPQLASHWVNLDVLSGSSSASFQHDVQSVLQTGRVVLGHSLEQHIVPMNDTAATTTTTRADQPTAGQPLSTPLLYPLKRSGDGPNVTAIITAVIPWTVHFANALPPSASVVVVVTVTTTTTTTNASDANDAAKTEPTTIFSLDVTGDKVTWLGLGDLHHHKYGETITLSLNATTTTTSSSLSMPLFLANQHIQLHIYPSTTMHRQYITWQPFFLTVFVGCFFVLAGAAFWYYDKFVERRQQVVMNQAVQSNAIVSSLFPETVRDRLFRRGSMSEGHDDGSTTIDDAPGSFHNGVAGSTNGGGGGGNGNFMVVQPAKMRLKTFLTTDDDDAVGVGGNACAGPSKPIADLFPRCTVLFADISGFTAWSSLRDPAQVFTLLESVYQAFDRIARRRGVFKVETIGDSYVAVTGLPEPQDDHAVLMALFARDCRRRMTEVTRKLELTLGPDTGDLRMRFGLHSGPVTAGVLRGEKSRFQLFGDTVNTAARMESTGERDRVQVSQATADLIRDAGKAHWLVKRDKPVLAKGKGEMQTYWCEIVSRRHSTGENSRCSISSVNSGDTLPSDSNALNSEKSALWGCEEEIPEIRTQKTKHQRLIDYNVDLLAQRLKQVIARRRSLALSGRRCSQGGLPPNWDQFQTGHQCEKVANGTVLDEVCEIIKLPQFNAREFKDYVDPDSIELDKEIMSQLKRYVTVIAAMYRDNPFHNFEHASHVTMSVNKLLQRVVTPDLTIRRSSLHMGGSSLQKQIASDLHNYTFGITSDPLTQFAIVFAALIHDVDHWGVSNMQLVKEGAPFAEKYKNKSVAEQNSVDLAWDLLMDHEEYGALQQCIFPTDADFKRFRQVVVNVVMATDIFDKELSELRKNRWEKAFSERPKDAEPDPDAEHRKATIVIEHIMQASDVAHTMQHWHVYQKWNRRLFDELYTAYKAGRMERDPSTFWYEAEIKFFNGYIIPLAKKLQECGVFGVASEECLNYALDNRREWESKGRMIIQELVDNYEQREREEAETAAPTKKRSKFSRRRSLITTGG